MPRALPPVQGGAPTIVLHAGGDSRTGILPYARRRQGGPLPCLGGDALFLRPGSRSRRRRRYSCSSAPLCSIRILTQGGAFVKDFFSPNAIKSLKNFAVCAIMNNNRRAFGGNRLPPHAADLRRNYGTGRKERLYRAYARRKGTRRKLRAQHPPYGALEPFLGYFQGQVFQTCHRKPSDHRILHPAHRGVFSALYDAGRAGHAAPVQLAGRQLARRTRHRGAGTADDPLHEPSVGRAHGRSGADRRDRHFGRDLRHPQPRLDGGHFRRERLLARHQDQRDRRAAVHPLLRGDAVSVHHFHRRGVRRHCDGQREPDADGHIAGSVTSPSRC